MTVIEVAKAIQSNKIKIVYRWGHLLFHARDSPLGPCAFSDRSVFAQRAGSYKCALQPPLICTIVCIVWVMRGPGLHYVQMAGLVCTYVSVQAFKHAIYARPKVSLKAKDTNQWTANDSSARLDTILRNIIQCDEVKLNISL